MLKTAATLTLATISGLAAAQPSAVITRNPGFLDANTDLTTGDEWGSFGAASVELDFFGDNNPGHGTLFADGFGNTGGIFQSAIAATGGTEYEMTIHVQWESNWDARTRFGLEFFEADDTTKISEVLVEIDELVDSGYRRHDMSAVAPPGTAFIRPIVLFDEVFDSGSSRAATIDNVLVREKDAFLGLNPGLGDVIGDGLFPADFWETFGAAAIDFEFFPNGNPGHATLFGDNPGNSGGLFQVGIPATDGESYTMSVDLSFEENWDADTFIALEFYGADDGFQIDKTEIEITETPGAGYLTFTLEATAPAGFTSFVRPVVRFENANGGADFGESMTVDNVTVQLTSDLGGGCNAGDIAEPFGVLDLADIDAFIAAFLIGGDAADIAPPMGVIDLGDVDAFIAAFLGGCP
ncbi:MAG: GC-type dockerin domain-anchored protein [Planctomycetota bacterium]